MYEIIVICVYLLYLIVKQQIIPAITTTVEKTKNKFILLSPLSFLQV